MNKKVKKVIKSNNYFYRAGVKTGFLRGFLYAVFLGSIGVGIFYWWREVLDTAISLIESL